MSEADRPKEDAEGMKEGSFRVIDRRRFAPDGTERPAEAERSEKAAGQGAETAKPAETSPGRTARATETQPPLAEPQGEPYGDDRSLPMEPTFSTLLMSLSTQALMCLGEIPEVAGEPPRRDLVAARSVIDLIAVLETKTRGNLDAGEAALLERILYDLRMRFVEISRA